MFEWDDANIDHLAERHGIELEEAEEALADPDRLAQSAHRDRTPGEPRRAVLGVTETGRLLFVVYARRGERLRVISARPAIEMEARRYWSRRR